MTTIEIFVQSWWDETDEAWRGRVWSLDRDPATKNNWKHGYEFVLPLPKGCDIAKADASSVKEATSILKNTLVRPETVNYVWTFFSEESLDGLTSTYSYILEDLERACENYITLQYVDPKSKTVEKTISTSDIC